MYGGVGALHGASAICQVCDKDKSPRPSSLSFLIYTLGTKPATIATSFYNK